MTTEIGQYNTELIFSGDSDVGQARKHKLNQDAFDTYEHYCTNPGRITAKGKLFVVADGMGGAAGGAEASTMAVDVVCRTYYEDPDLDIVASLERAIQAANTQIQQHGRANPELRGLGTTIVVAVVRSRTLVVGNVGDSRAYLFRHGELRQISLDHTTVQEQVREGLLTPEEAATHPRRHVLSRNLGYRPKAGPDFDTRTLVAGDTILLCTDGLWGTLEDHELADVLRHARGDAAVQTLIDLANARGGPDNISAIVIHVERITPSGGSVTTDLGEGEAGAAKGSAQPRKGAQDRLGLAQPQPGAQASTTHKHGEAEPRSTAVRGQGKIQAWGQQYPWQTAGLGVLALLLIGVGVYFSFTFFRSQPAAGANPASDVPDAGLLPSSAAGADPLGIATHGEAVSATESALTQTPAPAEVPFGTATLEPTAATPPTTPPRTRLTSEPAASLTGLLQYVAGWKTDQTMVRSAALSSDGALLATGSASGLITLWQVTGNRIQATFQDSQQPINSLALSADGQWLASAVEGGAVHVWALPNLAELASNDPIRRNAPNHTLFAKTQGSLPPAWSVAFAPDLQIASAAADTTVKVWKLGALSPINTFGEPKAGARGVAVTADGQRLVVVEAGGTVTVYGQPNNIVLTAFSPSADVQAVAISADGRVLAIAEKDGTITLHDVEPNKVLDEIRGYYKHSSIASLAFTQNEKFLVVTQANGTVEWWSLQQAVMSRLDNGMKDTSPHSHPLEGGKINTLFQDSKPAACGNALQEHNCS
ncbi:MAG: protein phosphatase 2C domain-containing protein [Chloroflexota bacterium]|nr:protein phosphatase 2C domain-containing protein [Chloroflexota bacterium]